MKIEKALSFDDVLLQPRFSNVKKGECSVIPRAFKNISPQIPIIASPMSSVTEYEMVKAMSNIQAEPKYQYKIGGLAIHHRYCSIEKLLGYARDWTGVNDCYGWSNTSLPIAIGSIPSHKETIDKLLEIGHKFFCVDVANGTHENALNTIAYIREKAFDADIMSGSIATPEQADLCINAGANILRIGVGPGSACTTRVVTGCGIPLFQSIVDIYTWLNRFIDISPLTPLHKMLTELETKRKEMKKNKEIILVADGGIRNSGDIVKALAAGADYVILGNLLAGTDESPGEIEEIPTICGRPIANYKEIIPASASDGHTKLGNDSIKVKKYFGMASAKALIEGNKKDPNHLHIEGEEFLVPYTGPVVDTISRLIRGLKQGMFYVGAADLQSLKARAKFVEISSAGQKESEAHGKFSSTHNMQYGF